MFKFILPTISIGIAAAGFFMFTDPLYKNISVQREQIASYNEALDNSKALEAERDKLTQKHNAFSPDDLTKLQRLLPDNVDNIRLILEIEKIASPYGMVLKNVKYSPTEKDAKNTGTAAIATTTATAAPQAGSGIALDKTALSFKNYGVWDLEFSTQGSYSNFIYFMKDLESNLRITDISSIQFSSGENTELKGVSPSSSEAYTYNFKIRTYWLKN